MLIFVYGTLKEGFPNFHVNRGTRLPGEYRTVQRLPLLLVGERCTPWLLDQPGQGQRVSGQLFSVDAAALAELDRLEGLGQAHGYRRVPLAVTLADAPDDSTALPGVMAYVKSPAQLEGQPVQSGPHAVYTEALAALYRQRPTPPLYQATVPVLLRYLGQLQGLVNLAGTEALLQARLAPDMLSFHQQVATAAHLALRIVYPLVGGSVPPYGDEAPTQAGLTQRLSRVSALLQALPAEAFTYAAERRVHEQAGEARLDLPAAEFVHSVGLPNFFFHVTLAYALLRQAGVALGKADFDGWHVYRG